MKKKTWIISALMYAMVFMACFGVLHFMKKLMEPAGPVQMETGTEGFGQESVDGDDGKRPEDRNVDSLIKTATDSQAEKPEEVIREEGYTGWKKQFPGLWTPPQDTEEPYVPPRLVWPLTSTIRAPRQVTAVRHSSCLWSEATVRSSSTFRNCWRHSWTRS